MDNALLKELASSGAGEAFACLAEHYLESKNYPMLFETRLMQTRWELGMPLASTEPPSDLAPATRKSYDDAFVATAREVGLLYLGDGNIPRAWPYLRAVGETAQVAHAIDALTPDAADDSVLEIAFHERANARKGFELILGKLGICRAISFFSQYPDAATRDDALRLLLRTLHSDLRENLRRVIAGQEGEAPPTESVRELIAGRAWLFGEFDYYIDTSHLVSVLRYTIDLEDADSLSIALELAEYGRNLSQNFRYGFDSPFEGGFDDYAVFLKALVEGDVDPAVERFRAKLERADETATAAAVVLTDLLERCGRAAEAAEVAAAHLANDEGMPAQEVFALCERTGRLDLMQDVATRRGDALHFLAGELARRRRS